MGAAFLRHCVRFGATLLVLIGFAGARAATPDWPKSLTLATASPGGIFYAFGNDFAPVLAEQLGITVSQLPSQGSVHNVKLLDNGGAQLGIIAMGVAQQGWKGDGSWTGGKPFQNMRALFPMFSSDFQAVVLRKSGIQSLAELENKRVGVGPRAGAGGTYVPNIFKLLGITAKLSYGSYESVGADLLAERIDALVSMISAPLPAIEDVDLKSPISLLSLSAAQIKQIREPMPELSQINIQAKTYRSQTDDYLTVGSSIFLIGRNDLPEDLVYRLVKVIAESQPRLLKAHPAASGMVATNARKNEFLPFHRGAVRYYREIGIPIAASLIPTD